ncbi:MAG: hypothetical protein JWN07_2456, partial [Hyphomicrobiales bacterium]|nr:hypothetical protein [Hyphomicrobiales bacterium]
LGGSYDLAMMAQVAVTLGVVACVWRVCRSQADLRLKQALVFPGVLLSTPYCIDYDMVLLAPALVLLAAHGVARGFVRWEISVIALVFVTPILARLVGGALHLPLGTLVLSALFVWTFRRARADARDPARIPGTGALRTSPAPPLPSAS